MDRVVVGAGGPARVLAETVRVAGRVEEEGEGVALAAVMAAGVVAAETGRAGVAAGTVTRAL